MSLAEHSAALAEIEFYAKILLHNLFDLPIALPEKNPSALSLERNSTCDFTESFTTHPDVSEGTSE